METKEAKEMIADIIEEYRADADKMDCGELYQPTTIYIRQLLNRIDAAWKREYDILNSEREKCRLYGLHEHEKVLKLMAKLKAVGNVAAMREAMTDLCNAALKVIVLRGHDAEDLRSLGFYMDKANLALANPPRNCDVGTAVRQGRRCRETFAAWRGKFPNDMLIEAIIKWTQMPYEEERKGEGDGR